jgi:protease I
MGLLLLGLIIGLAEPWVEAQENTSAPTRSRSGATPRTSRSRRHTEPVQIISLPKAHTQGTLSFEQILMEQAAVYEMTADPLDNTVLSQLAWAAQLRTDPAQVTAQGNRSITTHADPRSSIQLHFVTDTGVYRYQPSGHQLQQVSNLDRRRELIMGTVNPQAAGVVGCGIVITGPARGANARATVQLKRITLLETGRIAQNLRLQAAGLQLVTASIETFEPEHISPLLDLQRNREPIYVLFAGQRRISSLQDPSSANIPARAKRVVFVVPPIGFNESELFESQRLLGMAGVETMVSSLHQGPITGALGQVGESTMSLSAIPVQQIDALIFIGGPGMASLATNVQAQKLAQRAQQQSKLLGATSTAPILLAQAGLLKGVRVTADPTLQGELQNTGAVFTGNPVERDGTILTARGPSDMTVYARTVVNALAGN